MTVINQFCENCGAELRSPDPQCAQCGAPVLPGRDVGTCPQCGKVFREDDNFCSGCGLSLAAYNQVAPQYCTKCGERVHMGARFCRACGAPVRGPQGDDPATTLYGMPRIESMECVYAPPDFFKRGSSIR